MKDFSQKCIPKDAVYKNVVVIGNGPSGISLSYMLAGNWPYWIPEQVKSHPDELLRARLNYADSHKSLVEQDLSTLANGLEGRTTNPVSLLLDSLQHPGADIGNDLPCMLEYKYHPEKEIDHVVLGKGPAGGSWHRMDPNLRTLSLSAWMSLPGLNFHEWDAKHPTRHVIVNQLSAIHEASDQNLTNCDNISNKSKKSNLLNEIDDALRKEDAKEQEMVKMLPRMKIRRMLSKEVETRALISRVAEYYEQYVHINKLDKYFMNNSEVVNIMPIKPSSQVDPKFKEARWLVMGYHNNKHFSYVCKNLVLANGGSDLANRLGLRGEDKSISWLKYELPELEKTLNNLSMSERAKLKPVMIVGAGLSACDAVTICRNAGIKVIHVYRKQTAGLDKLLPENIYPEYFEVHNMMKNSQKHYDLYKALPEHTISEIVAGGRFVTVQNLKTNESTVLEVSYCAILIGSRPDLRLLSHIQATPTENALENNTNNANESPKKPIKGLFWLKNFCDKCRRLNYTKRMFPDKNEDVITDCNTLLKLCKCEAKSLREKLSTATLHTLHNDGGAVGFGENPKKSIDCKNNPIAVNKHSNQILHAPQGLYALGPLVGDNFVRFIPGGALAITSKLNNEND